MDQEKRSASLVLEGGGYRGVFTAGVLDVLMEHGITDFVSVWGTSAGALNAAGFKSCQIGRAIRIMLAFRDDRRLMSFFSLATTGNITGGDFLYHTVQDELDPCDVETFNSNPMRMYAVASDVVFGMPHYFEVKRLPDDVDMIRASSSLPLVSTMVEIDGHRYLDGGTTDSVPVEMALSMTQELGAGDCAQSPRALVVLTQHREYIKGRRLENMAVLSRRYKEYPLYIKALKTRATRYMEQRDRIWKLEQEGVILVIAPERPVTVATNEHAGGPLLDLYLQGRRQTEQRIDEILDFLQ